MPANWVSSPGATLSISPLHYKAGTQSLRWDWVGGSVLTVTNPGITAADVTDFYKNTCDFWVWNGTAVPGGKLRVEFMNGATAQYWFDFYLDYTGWRRAVRSFTNDMAKKSSPSATFTSVRITVQATGAGSLYLDDVTWVGDRFTRIRDAQNPDIAGASALTTCFSAYGVALDPLIPPTPTATELVELNTIRSRWLAATKGTSTPSASSVTSAGTSFSALGIVEDANGIRGVPLGAFNPDLESWPLTLARDYAWGTSATKTASRDKVLQLARHLMDQGHVANSNTVPTEAPGPDGYSYRGLPNALLLLAPAYDAATKAKMWEYFRWAYLLGDFWTDTWERNTDYVYLQSLQELGAILFLAPSDAEAVRQLKGYKRYMERFWQFSEGSEDGIKVDGTGFHHRSHYDRYMYAYKPPITTFYYMRGTSFQIDQPTYENIRLANFAQLRISADGAGTSVGYFGNSHVGRSPFDTDLKSVDQVSLQQLGEIGGAFYGQSADPVVARAYNRRFGVAGANSHALFAPYGAEDPPDGFLQFNYSPLGIYRRANWVASIRAPQRYFWSSEIFPSENRYGRYQAYGALEILYHGGRTASGQQVDGWDWNHTPGATTIVLPDSKLVAENDREDVRSQLNFSGALAFRDGQSGLYAANFQESNAGSNHNPSFVWRKSWFAFGPQIVCLGSDIANNDAANPTATTLLQGALAAPSTVLTLNGGAITAFPHSSTVSGASTNWLLDAFGTGYLVQPGSNLRITRGTQTSADHDGVSAPTTGNFAKVWLDHGTAPSAARYEYAVFPATTSTAMATAATAHANAATKPYQVIQHNGTAHIVKWRASGQIGYAIYATTALPVATQTAGLLRSVQRPCLVMTQLGAARDAWVSVVDPDLNFTNAQAGYGVPDASRARTLDFTINGAWTLAADNPSATTSVVATTATTTTLRVTTQHGLARHVHLEAATPPDVSIWANLGTDWTDPANWGGAWGGTAPANDLVTHLADLGSATVDPALNTAASVKGLNLAGNTTLSGTGTLATGAGGILATGDANTLALAGLTLGASQTWDVGAGNLTVSSAVGGPIAHRLTKTGDGTLTLSGLNTYGGGLVIAQGTVILAGDQSGATGGIDQKASGTSLFIGNTTQASPARVVVGGDSSIAIGETSPSGAATRILAVSGSPAFATSVTNQGNLTVGRGALATVGQNASWLQNGPMTIAGVGGYGASLAVTAGGAFVYGGAASIAIKPAADNSGDALLAVGDGAAFTTARGFVFGGAGNGTGTGQFTLSGQGVLRLSADIADLFTGAATGGIRLGDGGGGIIDTNGFNTTLSRVLADSPGMVGGLRKSGAGTLTLSGNNTYTGATTITGGVLATPFLAAGGVASGIGAGTGAGGLVLDGGTLRYTGAALTWTRNFTLGTNGAEFDLSAATGQLNLQTTLSFGGSGPRTVTFTTGPSGGRFNSPLADGPGGLTTLVKKGAGSLIVSGSNTYTGPLQILAGTVQYGNAGLGGESSGAGHSVAISAGATLSFRHAGNNTVVYNAPISGAGAVAMNYNNLAAGGSLTLGGNNTFSGGLTVSPSSGTNVLVLRAGGPAALGSGPVSLGQYGALDVNGFSNTIGLLAGSGTNGRVTNNGATAATLTLAGAGNQTFGGLIQDGAAKLALAKSGPGTQVLAGALTHTGDTTVGQGGLELAASSSLTFRPLGNGVVNRVTVAAGTGATATFRGSFALDLTAANLTSGNTWTLVAAAAPAATYAATFQVVGFIKSTPPAGNVWTKLDGPRTWTFTEATGVLRLQISGFASWVAVFSPLPDAASGGDPDGDGVSNLLEFVLGGDPALPDAGAILPVCELVPEGLRFTFHRTDASESEVALTFQYGADLLAWNDLPLGAMSGGPDANGVSFTVEENAAAADLVTITVPLAPAGRVFGRLHLRTNP